MEEIKQPTQEEIIAQTRAEIDAVKQNIKAATLGTKYSTMIPALQELATEFVCENPKALERVIAAQYFIANGHDVLNSVTQPAVSQQQADAPEFEAQ